MVDRWREPRDVPRRLFEHVHDRDADPILDAAEEGVSRVARDGDQLRSGSDERLGPLLDEGGGVRATVTQRRRDQAPWGLPG